jgi:hypothetical protein
MRSSFADLMPPSACSESPVAPPTPRIHQGFLCNLPHPALHTILHRAGPRTRELCTLLLDVYGPLRRLTPRNVHTPGELLAALARSDLRHVHLTSLDLSHVRHAITPRSLEALCRALPSLRTLRLPSYVYCTEECDFTAAALAAATAHLPNLIALHAPALPDPIPAPSDKGSPQLQELALLSPMLPPSTTALSCLTRLSTLSLGRCAAADVPHLDSLLSQLPALSALSLHAGDDSDDEGTASLPGLTQLTALTVMGLDRASPMLHDISTLTDLRRLALLFDLLHNSGGIPGPAWITRLTLLTSLHVDIDTPEEEVDQVALYVPHLPALRELFIGDCNGCRGCDMSAAACAHLAAARSSLGLLHFSACSPPASLFTEVLPQLTGLTCLRLDCVTYRTPFSWLAVLTNLRELWYVGVRRYDDAYEGAELPCKLLAGLRHLDTLSLTYCSFVDAPYMAQLCGSMPQLRGLDLCCNNNMGGAGLSALQRLTNLEVLGLARVADSHHSLEGLEGLRAPASLRRCYLGPVAWPPGERAKLGGLLDRHVEVVFSQWSLLRANPYGWGAGDRDNFIGYWM